MAREYLLEFRADFNAGPKKFKLGDRLWTTVTSLVVGNGEWFRECYRVFIDEDDPDHEAIREGVGPDWNGGLIIPCSFVRFSDEEYDLRKEREYRRGA